MSSYEATDLRLGVVGAGKIGTAIARAAVAGGYDVAISGSGDVERIELIVEVLAPGARAVTTDDLVRHGDLIVLAVPMHRFRELPGDLFAGKILVDAMNYWEEIDGTDEDLATAPMGTSVVVQEHFPLARVVKSLNHLGYFKFDPGRRPLGAPDRLARHHTRPSASTWCPSATNGSTLPSSPAAIDSGTIPARTRARMPASTTASLNAPNATYHGRGARSRPDPAA